MVILYKKQRTYIIFTEKPKSLRIKTPTRKTVTIKWDKPDDDRKGTLTGYVFEKLKYTNGRPIKSRDFLRADQTEFDVRNWSPGKVFRVAACYGEEQGPFASCKIIKL